jgi:hypothetical protein
MLVASVGRSEHLLREGHIMAFTFRLPVLTGVAAVTLCVAPMLSNEADAQRFGPRLSNHRYYSGHGGFDPAGFQYGTGGYGYSAYGTRGYGYNAYGQGPYGYRTSGRYVTPLSGGYGRGTSYHQYNRGLFPQRRTFGSAYRPQSSRFYSPYGYGVRY